VDVDQLVLDCGLNLTHLALAVQHMLHCLVSRCFGVGARSLRNFSVQEARCNVVCNRHQHVLDLGAFLRGGCFARLLYRLVQFLLGRLAQEPRGAIA